MTFILAASCVQGKQTDFASWDAASFRPYVQTCLFTFLQAFEG